MASRRFLEKGNAITLPSDAASLPESHPPAANSPVPAAVAPSIAARPPRTAIGGMAAFMQAESVANKRLEQLERDHAPFVGADPVRQLDPRTIRRSRWANRHQTAFAMREFAELKEDIRSAGGNVQAIKVRPVREEDLSEAEKGAEPPIQYEVVFGHRRHAACLELGLPVSAVIKSMSDRELFGEMDRENRKREDLSAYEQGVMYLNALESGLFESMRKLAEAVGVDHGLVSKAVGVAQLPDVVVQAFDSPVEIQYRWAKPLSEALQRDPDGLMERARRVRHSGATVTPGTIYAALIGEASDAAPVSSASEIVGRAGKVSVVKDKKGRLLLKFDRPVSAALQAEVEKALRSVLS
ncbi:ParB/RepB/Spo0J family partition protein [Variovorax sp. Sphag1AA]|uniref:ParB/RepB/Spo0J family partition protein n=1 Tax=Variovorax sp. Sphag1AA TaxID=2587027 RepID=UPI00160BF4A1|nr:ParB/RepB/Spo0J family partition protein [Variovorax sp. Sphag1AA]MBB3180866.1 ParB family chromosome partitioning protein [Variovorax sp. Sphag1AA]